MLDVAIRRSGGSAVVDWQRVGVRSVPSLPVAAAFDALLPGGIRRGSTVSVSGSVSLLLALLGAASAGGAWCALVGFPRVSAEAVCEYGLDLTRVAFVPDPGVSWTTVVAALLDAVDVVVAWPPREVRGRGRPGTCSLSSGDVRRLAARARSKDAVLVPYFGVGSQQWPGADVRLHAHGGEWSGIGVGTGRLRARRVEVIVGGRGVAARPRSAQLWLPVDGGAVEVVTSLAPVIDLAG